MGLGVVAHGGVGGAPVGSCLLHVRANDGEGGGEVVEGGFKRSAGVADREGNEFHPSPIFFEGRDEGGVLLCLYLKLGVASEVSAKSDLDDEDGEVLLVKGGRT